MALPHECHKTDRKIGRCYKDLVKNCNHRSWKVAKNLHLYCIEHAFCLLLRCSLTHKIKKRCRCFMVELQIVTAGAVRAHHCGAFAKYFFTNSRIENVYRFLHAFIIIYCLSRWLQEHCWLLHWLVWIALGPNLTRMEVVYVGSTWAFYCWLLLNDFHGMVSTLQLHTQDDLNGT